MTTDLETVRRLAEAKGYVVEEGYGQFTADDAGPLDTYRRYRLVQKKHAGITRPNGRGLSTLEEIRAEIAQRVDVSESQDMTSLPRLEPDSTAPKRMVKVPPVIRRRIR